MAQHKQVPSGIPGAETALQQVVYNDITDEPIPDPNRADTRLLREDQSVPVAPADRRQCQRMPQNRHNEEEEEENPNAVDSCGRFRHLLASVKHIPNCQRI